MRILDVKTIKHIEKEAIAIGLNSWEGLMESAAFAFSKHFVKYYLKPNHQTIFILIGPGNNGGDGIIIAQILNILTKLKINALLIDTFQKQSQLQKAVLKRILLNRNIDIYSVDNQSSLPEINENDVIIDSIFGYGLNRSVKGELIPLFQHINFSKATKVSVDMPSGMLSDSINETEVTIINSDHIITFHSPKLSLFYPENHHLSGWL